MAGEILRTGLSLWPHKIWKRGAPHPYADHIHVKDSRPSTQGCLKSRDLLDIHREWRSSGLDIVYKGMSRLSRDLEIGDHVCSFSMELFNLHYPGNNQLKFVYANHLVGPYGLLHFWLLLDSGLLSGFLRSSYYLTKNHLEGFRVPASTQKAFQDMDPEVIKMFGYSSYHDWYNIMMAFAQYEISRSLGKLDDLKGVNGMLRFSDQTRIAPLSTLNNAASSLGLPVELGWPHLTLEIADIREFLANSEGVMPFPEIMEKAKGRIRMDSLIYYFLGRPKEEYAILPEILSAGKLPTASTLSSALPIDNATGTEERWDIIRSLKDLPSPLLEFAASKHIKISDIEGQLVGKSIGDAWRLVKDLAAKKPIKSPPDAVPVEKKPEVVEPPEDPRLKVVKDLLRTKEGWNKYRGDINQAKFANDAGFADLDEFFAFLNHHYFARRLGYNRTHIHKLDNVIAFWPELITWARRTKYPIAKLGKFFLDKDGKELTKAQCKSKFKAEQKELEKKDAERLAKKEKAAKEAQAKGIAPNTAVIPQKKTRNRMPNVASNSAMIDEYFAFRHKAKAMGAREDDLNMTLVDFMNRYGQMSAEDRAKAVEELIKKLTKKEWQ